MNPIYFLRSQYTPLPYPTKPFTNQTVIVTGSNVGLGFEAARHFVRLNAAKVILAVRTLSKGEEAKKSILASEKDTSTAVEVWSLNLSSHESVKEFARKASQELDRLDVLIQNAGIVTYKYVEAEGNESSITVNVISPFLLSLLLLPKLRETAERFHVQPRLVFVESFVHYNTSFPERKAERIFEELRGREKARMNDRYNVSKLIGILATRQLASLTSASPKGDNIIINCLNPGFVVTEAMREWTGVKQAAFRFFRVFIARRTEMGARTLVASAEAEKESHGWYMDNGVKGRLSKWVESEDGRKTQERVWDELAEILDGIEPGVTKNI